MCDETVDDLTMMRTMLQIRKASRRFKETGIEQIVYRRCGKPGHMDLPLWLEFNLDGPDTTRVCHICHPAETNHFQRFRYNPATDKFDKI